MTALDPDVVVSFLREAEARLRGMSAELARLDAGRESEKRSLEVAKRELEMITTHATQLCSRVAFPFLKTFVTHD